ncbi:hypothetical protein [Haloactinopolyspora alba]|nr:hypothetical protein [Haloactinopolyspora alba]
MSASCLFLPSTAHVAAGGAVPTHAGFVLVGALLSVACVGLADRRRSLGEIAAVLLLSQPALHVLLVLAGQHGTDGAVTPGMTMLLAHVVAAGVLTVLLSGAESVAWSMASLSATILLRRVRRLLETPLPNERPGTEPSPQPAPSARVVDLIRSTPWRGPPAVPGS